MKRSTPDRIFGALLLVPFALAIAWLHYGRNVPFVSFIYGSGSWGFGCLLKMLVYHALIRRLRHDDSSILRISALNGLVSGVTELGLALVFFVFLKNLTFEQVVAFGIGIGTIEAYVVATASNPLKGTALESASQQLEAIVSSLPGARRLIYGYALPYAERLIATVIHVGTRGLVYVSYRSGDPMPFALALLVFFVADGLLGYRLLHQGKLANLTVLARTYAALLGLAAVALAGFLYYWSGGDYGAVAASHAGGVK